MSSRSVTFTGIRFENPFLLSTAPPTESESNIMRAFDAAPSGVEGADDIALRLRRRGRGEQEGILEPDTSEGDGAARHGISSGWRAVHRPIENSVALLTA